MQATRQLRWHCKRPARQQGCFRTKRLFQGGRTTEFALAVLFRGTVLRNCSSYRAIFTSSLSSVELVFWWFCPGEFAFDGTSVRQHVFAVFRIKRLSWISAEAWVCGASVLPCFFCLCGGRRLYLPRTLCFYLSENTSLVVSFALQGKASDPCEQHSLCCSFNSSVLNCLKEPFSRVVSAFLRLLYKLVVGAGACSESRVSGLRLRGLGLHCSARLGKLGLSFKLEGFGLALLRQSLGCWF